MARTAHRTIWQQMPLLMTLAGSGFLGKHSGLSMITAGRGDLS